jgi:hypothetical protein
MNRISLPSTGRRPSSWQEASLDSKAFALLLAAVFSLTLGVAAAGWSEAAPEPSAAVQAAAHHVFA